MTDERRMRAETIITDVLYATPPHLQPATLIGAMREFAAEVSAERDAEMRPLLVEVRALLQACNIRGDTISRLDAAIDAMKEKS